MKSYLTKSGYILKKIELEKLEKDLVDVIDKIVKARELGDFSENAELQFGKRSKELLECRISHLRNILTCAEILDIQDIKDKNIIQIGAKILLTNLENIEDTKTIYIVGDFEADPVKYFVSYKAPIAIKLLGKTLGDKIAIQNRNYVISNIEWCL